MVFIFNTDVRQQVISSLYPVKGEQQEHKDSTLLKLFSVVREMQKMQNVPIDAAYKAVINAYGKYSEGYILIKDTFRSDLFNAFSGEQFHFDYVDFLTYVVPALVCNPQKTIDILQSIKPDMSYIERSHHIIMVKLLAYKLDELYAKKEHSDCGYEEVLDKLYDAYKALESKATLRKDEFLRLYASINTYELSPKVLSPMSRGAGFKDKDLEELMALLTDELQLTRAQQLDLVAQCFVNKEQAVDVIPTEQIYNFTHYKNMAERKKLVRRAHRLMAKIPPLELICAISIRKKNGRVSSERNSEATIVPNDVMLEIGFIYPMFKNLIGWKREDEILLVYPSAFFVRKVLADESLRDRKITIVFQDNSVVDLLKYQIEDRSYVTQFNKDNLISAKVWEKWIEEKKLPYNKIFLFGNHMPVEHQRDLTASILEVAMEYTDVFTLLSTYAIEKAEPLGGVKNQMLPYLNAISLIPQGINNSSFPRRKMWVHFNVSKENGAVKVYRYTLDATTKIQALSLVREAPMEIPCGEISQLNQSIRKCYSQELMFRKAQGRTKTMAIQHEITPDIPVWCSRSFPNGKEKNPRLEAYVCMPPSEDRVLRGFSERGEVIQSTKKHTTQEPTSKVLEWLENTYPFAFVQQRYSAAERKKMGTNLQQKPEISIREEIIEQYAPVLEKKNIALKTLWYLYPDLSNKYCGSDYLALTEMMHTIIGQQRVCDITSELIEKLLVALYPELIETALWHKYKILSVALEKAKQCKYCDNNPLEDALREEKLRRKLFAQVRKQLVKKHLEEPELRLAYHAIFSKIQNGQYEYVGVLIRLLTGLESSIVCALRWRDIVKATNVDVAYFVITRQVSNDGKEYSGFSDIEDYMCFPLPAGLRSLLEEFQVRLCENSDENCIMESIIPLSSANISKTFTPIKLNELTKGVLKEFNVDDNYFNIATGNNEFRKTNLNKYMGDFIRENFRYWADKIAKLLPAELSYLLRNRVDSTCGRFYCDFQNEASLAIIATKLSRMECQFMQGEQPFAQREAKQKVYQFTREVQPSNGYRQKVSVEIVGEASVEVQVCSPRGIWSNASSLVDKEGNPI